MTSFAFEPIYGSLLLTMAVAAVTVGVILAVTPPTESPTRRRWLISLRLLAAFTLLLAAFRPALFRTDNQLTEAALVIAIDTSRSMTLPDGDGNSRWETQIEIWKSLAGSILGLDGDLDVRLLAYDSQTRTIAVPAVDSLQSELPAGQATDISAAAEHSELPRHSTHLAFLYGRSRSDRPVAHQPHAMLPSNHCQKATRSLRVTNLMSSFS